MMLANKKVLSFITDILTLTDKIVSPKLHLSYNIVTVKGTAASRVFFHLKAEAVRM